MAAKHEGKHLELPGRIGRGRKSHAAEAQGGGHRHGGGQALRAHTFRRGGAWDEDLMLGRPSLSGFSGVPDGERVEEAGGEEAQLRRLAKESKSRSEALQGLCRSATTVSSPVDGCTSLRARLDLSIFRDIATRGSWWHSESTQVYKSVCVNKCTKAL